MYLKYNLSTIFLDYVDKIIDIESYIDTILKYIKEQRIKKGIFKRSKRVQLKKDSMNFLKIIHIYIITIYESFNREFYSNLQETKSEFEKKKLPKAGVKYLSEFLEKSIKIDIKNDFKYWKYFREHVCRRNVIAHSMGVIDKDYIKCNKLIKSNLKEKVIGENIYHGILYIKLCLNNIVRYFIFIIKNNFKFLLFRKIIELIDNNNVKSFENLINKVKEIQEYYERIYES